MELFKYQHMILALLSLVIVVSNATNFPSSEDYWNTNLPNSPMPKSLKDLLNPINAIDFAEDKTTAVKVTKGAVNVDTSSGKPGGTSVNVGHGNVGVDTGKGKPAGGTAVNVGHGNVGVHTGKPGRRTNVGVGKGGVTVGTGTKKGRPVYVRVHPGPDPFNYKYAASETQLHDKPNVALFFLEQDLHVGQKMNLDFFKITNQATLLPRQIAESIPFSSNELPQIFDKFSVKPNTYEAEQMKKTIKECEETGVKGEEKYCATSLESMIDFTTSKLGHNVKATSTNAEYQEKKTSLKEYIIKGVKKLSSAKAAVVCHKVEYAYAVFYCHKTETTVAYEVSMAAADGSKVNGVAVCHRDTATWNPKHLAFQVLKVKPGSVPVCHFLPEDHIVWVPKY